MTENVNKRRARRVRHQLRTVSEAGRKRLSVSRSNANIYAQIIDDDNGVTLASASTMDKALRDKVKGNNVEAAKIVGDELAKRAKKAGVSDVYFDRGRLRYHGRVKALADAVRDGGLKF